MNAQPTLARNIPDSFIAPLTDVKAIAITGPDSKKFLQGQQSADMNNLTSSQGTYGCHCDAKGKMWSLLTLIEQQEEKLLALINQSAAELSLAELNKYAVFSQCELSSLPDIKIYAGRGPAMAQLVQEQLGQTPESHLATVSNDRASAICFTDLDQPRWILVLPASDASQISPSASQKCWDLLDILAGLTHLEASTSNQFVPQMLNMQAIGAISFNKGCYMGQETIARTKFLGRNKRATYILRAPVPLSLPVGADLEMQLGEHWRRGGTVLKCVSLAEETWLLAVLPNDTQSEAQFRFSDSPDTLFSVQPLPYSLDDNK